MGATGAGLDDVFASVVRLRICAYLSGCEEADFKAVQDYCGLTQSHLSKQLTSLAEREYVHIRKVASGRYTNTRIALTGTGQHSLDAHVTALQHIVSSAQTRS